MNKLDIYSQILKSSFLEFKYGKKDNSLKLQHATNLVLNSGIAVQFTSLIGKEIQDILTFFSKEDIHNIISSPFNLNVIYKEDFLLNIRGIFHSGNLYITISDVSKQKILGDKINAMEKTIVKNRKAIKKMEQKKEAAEEFTNHAVHDLKNPVNHILGFGQILKQEIEEEQSYKDEHLEYIDIIIKSSEKFTNLINELLELSQAKQEVQFEVVKLADIFEEIRDEFIPEKNNSEISMEFNITLENIKANNSMLKSLIRNLVSNSIKYKRENVPPKINITTLFDEKDKKIIIEYTDNGRGIEKDKIQDILKPFEKLKASDKGHGLGLNICCEIVDGLGGHLIVDSQVGKGTKFRIELPEKLMV